MKDGFRQAMAWLHTWIGLIFGWLLFAIFLTGTLSYFRGEITHWMTPELPARVVSTGATLQAAQKHLQEHAPNATRWYLWLPSERSQTLSVTSVTPGEAGQRDKFQNKTLDPLTGSELQARDTLGGDFFYRFHFQLEMPHPWGRWLSTAAAMVMFIALITGIIVHKKVFKEFFTFRPSKGQRSWLDGHNALSILALPFHLMITYSSLIIFMYMVMPLTLQATYGPDTDQFFKERSTAPQPAKPAGTPAPMLELTSLLTQVNQTWGTNRVERVVVDNPGDANASVMFYRNAKDDIVYGQSEVLMLNGATGELISGNTKAAPVPSLISGGFYGLHLGRFAGPTLRWLYFIFGMAGTAMIGTGLVMWLSKRTLKHAKAGVLPFELRLVQILNIGSMAGLTLGVVGVFWANRLLPVDLASRSDWEVKTFFILWLLSVVHALLRPARRAWLEQLGLAALLFATLPLLDMLTSGQYLLASLQQGDWVLLSFDLTCLGAGLLLGWLALKFRFREEAKPVRKVARVNTEAPAVSEGVE